MKLNNLFLYIFFVFVTFANNLNAKDTLDVKNLGSPGAIVGGEMKYSDTDSLGVNNIRLLTIGIGSFPEPYVKINAPAIINRYKEVETFLEKTFHKTPIHIPLSNSIVNKQEITDQFTNLMNNVNNKDLVIISIASHGDFIGENKEYVLVCTDGTIQGSEFNFYVEEIAKKGAYVLFFIDTCRGGALFDSISINDSSKLEKIDGFVVYYASSKREENSKQIEYALPFSQRIIDIFSGKVNDSFSRSKWTNLDKIEACVNTVFSGEGIENQQPQHPNIRIFPERIAQKIRMLSLFRQVEDIPIIKKVNIVSPIKTDTVQKVSFYIGASVGQPLASAFVGATLFKNYIVHGKIEAGVSILPQREANSVYLYKSDNRFSGGYNYISSFIQPFVRLGAEIDLGKDWSLIPLVGLSFLSISGDPISDVGASDGKGEKATATCLSSNVRLAWAPFKKKNWQIHATAGYDVGIGDTNYNKLRENDDVKKMAEYLRGLRGQLGVVYNF